MILTDEFERPLPKGTVLDLQPYSPHTVVVGYNEWGLQVIELRELCLVARFYRIPA